MKYITAQELLEKDIEQPSWLIQGLFPETGIVMISSQPKCSKTMFALNASINVSNGSNFLGRVTKQGRVAFLDEEDGEVEDKDRLQRQLWGEGLETADIDFVIMQDLKFDLENPSEAKLCKAAFESYLNERKPVMVVVNSLVRFMSQNENSAEHVRKVFQFLKHFKDKTLIVLLHHCVKGTNIARGSTDFSAMVDVSYNLSRLKGKHRFLLTTACNRRGNVENISYFIGGDPGEPLIFHLDYVDDKQFKKSSVELNADEILRWLNENSIKDFRRKDIPGNYPPDGLTKALNHLSEEGKIERLQKGIYRRIN